MEQVVESHINGTWINGIYCIVQPYINKVAYRYFPQFHKTDHSACVAVRHASLIVFYRSIENLPEGAIRHPTMRVDGLFNKWVEYIFTPDYQLQDWFIKYIDSELDKRIRFLKMLADEGIFIETDPDVESYLKTQMGDKYQPPSKDRLYYIPLYESFRFVAPGAMYMLGRLVAIFHDQKINIADKDALAKEIIFNIQKLIVFTKESVSNSEKNDAILQENALKDSFIMFIFNILIPLSKSVASKQMVYADFNKTTFEDITQTINTELLSSILKYDETKNNSFFGYIKKILPLEVMSAIRIKKADEKSEKIDENSPNSHNDLVENYDFEVNVALDELKGKIKECLDDLPLKEKEAIKKSFFNNQRLNDTERKARYRGLQNLKAKYPELKSFIF